MVKLNGGSVCPYGCHLRKANLLALLLAMALVLGALFAVHEVEARDKGEDIILTKGKLIMRGGKNKGNLILDTSSKSSEMPPMMPMHFNPYSFYPMQHHHQPQVMIRPIYLEDYSAMHHHEPQHYHHQESHHYPQQHHEMEYQHQPYEGHEHQEMQQHHEEEQQEMPMGHHYEHEEADGSQQHQQNSYDPNQMMSMMMHGSGLQPAYHQMAAMQMFQPQQQPDPSMLYAQNQATQEQAAGQKDQQTAQSSNKSQSSSSLRTNPLAAIIRPLFKRNNKTASNNNNASSSQQNKS